MFAGERERRDVAAEDALPEAPARQRVAQLAPDERAEMPRERRRAPSCVGKRPSSHRLSSVDNSGARPPVAMAKVTGGRSTIAGMMNMTLLSIALLSEHRAAVSLAGMAHNLLWVTLGNIVSGALIMAAGYWAMSRPPIAKPALVVARDAAAGD